MMRIIRNRSIPNVDDDRLIYDRDRLHQTFHTQEGLHSFDGPRREMVDTGRKGRMITAELVKRGHPEPDCMFCTSTL
jgi:hypothetical protein